MSVRTHDKELEERTSSFENQYGTSALIVAVDKLIQTEKRAVRYLDWYMKLHRKVEHGCTDAHCEECDGRMNQITRQVTIEEQEPGYEK